MIDFDDFDFDDFDEDSEDYSDFDNARIPEEPSYLPQRVSHRYCVRMGSPTKKLVMFGAYEGIRRIGGGSFGDVYLARDPGLDREVAIKLCKVADAAHRDSLLREAQLIARISEHPNIVTIYELDRYESDREDDEFDGAPFIAMELAVGLPNGYPPVRTGKDLIRTQPGWQDCVDFYCGAGRGLAAAHAEGIVHGDFKPSNVLIGKRGAMVADFGLAHTLGSAERHTGGTDGYRAPELFGGKGNSPKTDQFAFCVSLWELLVGRLPVDDSGEPHPCPPGVMPRRLILALLRGLSVAPDDRWPSMDALLEELEQIRVMMPSPPSRKRPRLSRGFLVPTIVGAVLGAMVGALIVAQLMGRPQQRAELREVPSAGPTAEREESDPPNVVPEPSKSACAQSDDVFLVPSPELESACEMIRDGELEKAAEHWKRVQEERTPDGTPEQVMYVLTETAVVISTCEHYLGKLDDSSPLAQSTRGFRDQMQSFYDLSLSKIDPSQ